MRIIERTSIFKRDYKRVSSNPRHRDIEGRLVMVLKFLVGNVPLPISYRDHALSGDWKDHRDCHIKPDLVLLYRKPDIRVLQLVRLGSHSELGL
jgi:mRNA interferase YafQ